MMTHIEWGVHTPRVRRLTPPSTAVLRATAQRRALARVVPDRQVQSGAREARALPKK